MWKIRGRTPKADKFRPGNQFSLRFGYHPGTTHTACKEHRSKGRCDQGIIIRLDLAAAAAQIAFFSLVVSIVAVLVVVIILSISECI